MPYRRKSLLFRFNTTLHQLRTILTENVIVNSYSIAGLTTHQLIARDTKILTGNIPKSYIYCRESPHDSCSSEVITPV